jgi:hypothetical protein
LVGLVFTLSLGLAACSNNGGKKVDQKDMKNMDQKDMDKMDHGSMKKRRKKKNNDPNFFFKIYLKKYFL